MRLQGRVRQDLGWQSCDLACKRWFILVWLGWILGRWGLPPPIAATAHPILQDAGQWQGSRRGYLLWG